jgi:anti-anti-sigma factor
MRCQVMAGEGRITIQVSGQLIFSDTAAFADILQQLRSGTPKSCVVDLSELERIDSSGLRMLLLVHDVCRESEAELQFYRVKGQVRDMLLHSRFDTIVPLVD